jgi:hypothetical protein
MKRLQLVMALLCGIVGAATLSPGAAIAKPKVAGPKLSVIGFGINRLFVP